MGNLLDVLRKDGRKPAPSVFIDFEHAEPTDAEQAVYGEVRAVLDRAAAVLREIDEYKGAGDAIRNAISQPANAEIQRQAWEVLCPLVAKLQKFFQFSLSLEASLYKLLPLLGTEDPMNTLKEKQATAKLFAEILHFVLKFDDIKMSNPAIQNDFSYYRRTLSRTRGAAAEDQGGLVLSDEEANRMSLFYAYPNPMLKCITDATSSFVKENRSVSLENMTETLSVMARVCCEMIENPEYNSRFENPETLVFCQRVMVGCIILYDLIDSVGAFSKKNPSIDMRACVRALRNHSNAHVEGLINALKYTTKHFNDEDTPRAVKQLLQ